MTATAPRRDSSGEETLGALIATASRDLSALVRSEIELAKAELRVDVKNGATGGAMFGAAAFLGVLVVILLSIAAAYGLVALGLHPGLAFLAVAVFYLLVAVVLVLVGIRLASATMSDATLRTRPLASVAARGSESRPIGTVPHG